jgi:hypothetical protein
MAYVDDILTLSPDRVFTFNNVSTDTTATDTYTSTEFDAAPICRDSTHCLRTNGTSDNPTGVAFDGLQDASERMVALWFRCTAIQGPPTLIYREGGGTAGASLILWAGNNVMLQVWDDVNAHMVQIYCDKPLEINRDYHLAYSFKDTTKTTEVKFYIDGVEQSDSNVDKTLLTAMTPYTGTPEFGYTVAGDIPVGNGEVLLVAPVTGRYSHLSEWWGTTPSYSDFYDKVFSRGAIPQYTITSDTEANMQSQLDAIATTGDYPLGILIEEVSGGGDLNLTSTTVFGDSTSCHIRYEGTGTLNFTNGAGSNAVTYGGNVNILNPYTLTLNNLQMNTEVRVFEAGTTNEIAGEENVTTGIFTTTVAIPSIDVRIISLDYKITSFTNLAMTSDINIAVEQFEDRNYRND